MSLKITQQVAQAMGTGASDRVITQVAAQFMGVSNNHRRRVTSLWVNLMGLYPLNTGDPDLAGANRFTAIWANVMVPFTPNFEWIDMVIEEIFPFDISYESIGATRFQTDVVRVDSGHDQRSSRWDQPLMEYDIAYGVRTMEQLHGLIAFFRSVRGRRDAFLYYDHMDHTSTLAAKEEARRAPDVTPLDQQFGIGNHVKFKFQLVKTYTTPSGALDQVRPIYRPKPGTVRVAVGGLEVTNFEVDYARGVITFVSDWGKTGLNGMRIEEDNVWWRITGHAGDFTGLVVGDKIITQGWLNPLNNSSVEMTLRVEGVTADGSYIRISVPDGYGELETNRNGVSVYRHPAPKSNLVLTAGYEFYVPVRFDTDRLPVSLEEYGIGGAADVKLIEVRPSEMFDE